MTAHLLTFNMAGIVKNRTEVAASGTKQGSTTTAI